MVVAGLAFVGEIASICFLGAVISLKAEVTIMLPW